MGQGDSRLAEDAASVEQRLKGQDAKFQRLTQILDRYRRKNNSVAVLFDGVQQELNTFALDESKGTNENLKKLTAAMGTYKDSAVTFQDRQVHYVINWLRKLNTTSKNVRRITQDYKSKNKQAARDEENLRKQAVKTGDDTHYNVTAARSKLQGSKETAASAKGSFASRVVAYEIERASILKRALKEFLHSHIQFHAEGLEAMTEMYGIVSSWDEEDVAREGVSKLNVESALDLFEDQVSGGQGEDDEDMESDEDEEDEEDLEASAPGRRRRAGGPPSSASGRRARASGGGGASTTASSRSGRPRKRPARTSNPAGADSSSTTRGTRRSRSPRRSASPIGERGGRVPRSSSERTRTSGRGARSRRSTERDEGSRSIRSMH